MAVELSDLDTSLFVVDIFFLVLSVVLFLQLEVVRRRYYGESCKPDARKRSKYDFFMFQFIFCEKKRPLSAFLLLLLRVVFLVIGLGCEYLTFTEDTKSDTPFHERYLYMDSWVSTLFCLYCLVGLISHIMYLLFRKNETCLNYIVTTGHLKTHCFFETMLSLSTVNFVVYVTTLLYSGFSLDIFSLLKSVSFVLLVIEWLLLSRVEVYLSHITLPVFFSFLYVFVMKVMVFYDAGVAEFPYYKLLEYRENSYLVGVMYGPILGVVLCYLGWLAVTAIKYNVFCKKRLDEDLFNEEDDSDIELEEKEEKPKKKRRGLSHNAEESLEDYAQYYAPNTKIKIVVVGDGAVGKTCLLHTYCNDDFPSEYVPTVFDNYNVSITANIGGVEKTFTLSLWDTAGQEDYDNLRTLSYTDVDVFLLCFSVVGRTSYSNVRAKWLDELKKAGKKCAVILVGTKIDLREDPTILKELMDMDEKMVTKLEAEKMTSLIKAQKYLECSAKTREGVKEIFEEAVNVFINYNKGGRKK